MSNQGVIASTKTGVYEGFAEHRIAKFLGIRYAHPPTGAGRFAPPRPIEPSSDTIPVKTFGNRNHQVGMAEIIYGDYVPPGEESEDCLFLNVYAPADFDTPKPVMVWIHGGAFTSGSGNEYDPTRLVAENDVVVVTINYRLGVFGFIDMRPLGPDFADGVNLGMRDQVEALRWVNQNIAAFGGDPDNVMIWGESAGGTSVLTMLGIPSAKGLFHKCGGFSGAETLAPPFDQTPMIKQYLGVESNEDCVAKLMSMTSAEISTMQEEAGLYGGPCLDGTVITMPSCEAIKAGLAADIPIVTGTVKDEGTLLAPLFNVSEELGQLTLAGLAAPIGRDMGAAYFGFLQEHYPQDSVEEKLCRAWFDLFRSAALRVASTATQHGAGGWVYDFEVETDHELGTTHFADIPFAFNWIPDDPPLSFIHKPTPENCALAQKWSQTMVAFARTGDPNGAGLPRWPQYGPDGFDCLVVRRSPQVTSNPDGDMLAVYQVD